MNPEQQVVLIESIVTNPNTEAEQKLDLVRSYLKECRAKQVGKIIVDSIEGKRKRGRPKKSEHAKRVIESARQTDRENGFD